MEKAKLFLLSRMSYNNEHGWITLKMLLNLTLVNQLQKTTRNCRNLQVSFTQMTSQPTLKKLPLKRAPIFSILNPTLSIQPFLFSLPATLFVRVVYVHSLQFFSSNFFFLNPFWTDFPYQQSSKTDHVKDVSPSVNFSVFVFLDQSKSLEIADYTSSL